MNPQKRILNLIISILLISSLIGVSSISAEGFYSVRGDVYLDDLPAGAGLEIQLYFDNANNPPIDTTDGNGSYQIDWQDTGGYLAETGYFTVDYAGDTYAAFDESGAAAFVLILPETIGYIVDLYIYSSMPNVPPIAEANGPYTAAVGINKTFDATGSVDPDGTIDLYEWDLDGDGNFDKITSSKTTSYAYTTAGTYTVTLQVTDNDGATDTDTTTTTVIESDLQPPSKVTGLTVSDKKNGKLQLSWDEATDNVEVDYYKIYRDGTYIKDSISLSYLDTGLSNGQTYTYQVSAVDTSDNEGEKSDNATGKPTQSSGGGGGGGGGGFFDPGIPVADAGGPYTGNVDEAILFDGTLSNDSDGTIVSWEWDFGNGVTGSGETISYTYTQPGTYTVTLTVIDNDGQSDTDDTTATIVQPNRPPTQPIITGPSTGTKNTEYNFTATSTDLDGDPLQYEVDWDDGDTDQSTFLPNGTAFNTGHSWTAAGLYIISVEVTDNQTTTTGSHHILIDSIFVKGIGYLMDTDGDGTYDMFYSNSTGEETDAITDDDKASYLIDEDGDGSWDWRYYPETKELREYEGEPTGSDEIDWSLWILLIILIIVIVAFLALVSRSNKKKKSKKSSEKKSGDSKKK